MGLRFSRISRLLLSYLSHFMKEIPVKDLDSRVQKYVSKASDLIKVEPFYAASILSNIVQANPYCVEARQMLRKAQSKMSVTKKSGGLSGLFAKLSFGRVNESAIQKNPEQSLQSAEEQIDADFSNITAHKTLALAAKQLGLVETALLGYEYLFNLDQTNASNGKQLIREYIAAKKAEQAIAVGDIVLQSNPADDEAQELIKKASVQQTVDKGKWEEEKSFREKLKDEDEAQRLEQSSRAQTGEEGLRSLIEEALKKTEAEPENINVLKDLVNYYRKLEEFDNALDWLSKARELDSGKADVNLEALMVTLTREKMSKQIEVIEANLEENPEDATLKTELEKLQKEEYDFRLTQAESLVQRYPNEFSYRYDLGELYKQQGNVDGAIKELQLALRAPKVRVKALVLLGQSYMEKKFYDLAAEQLTLAKSEISGVTELKKEVIYDLGRCYESQGDSEKAMSEYKALYGIDIGYRDVSQKIDDFYSKS